MVIPDDFTVIQPALRIPANLVAPISVGPRFLDDNPKDVTVMMSLLSLFFHPPLLCVLIQGVENYPMQNTG